MLVKVQVMAVLIVLEQEYQFLVKDMPEEQQYQVMPEAVVVQVVQVAMQAQEMLVQEEKVLTLALYSGFRLVLTDMLVVVEQVGLTFQIIFLPLYHSQEMEL